MVKVSDLPVFDFSDYLDSEEAISEYLTAILKKMIPHCWLLRWVILPRRAA